ncbi:MAG: glutamate--tRNA ligase [candidate division Zixibacteria bacterium]|nr:glutamate--tRNA ligase [candidate division Zixibacteria bacterium]
MPDVRVRIAPSPSGYLHIGTARAALYNWLFARHNNGKFLLRIEDTDQARSSQEMVQVILDSLKWLGLESDEPAVYQSQRLDIHKNYVDKLLESGKAYRCWCEPEVLKQKQEQARKEKRNPRYDRACHNLPNEEKRKNIESGKPFAVRLHLPEGETTFDDAIVGEVTRKHEDLDDFIIARSDGRAVYNMAVVVDDHEMEISHVIRGNDHISNTFKQVLIYDGLGLQKPKFAHIPLILGKNKAKMSKRDGAAGVTDYAKMGYLKEAVINFIALLGWSPGDDREVMSLEEMTEAFSLERINPANAVFDMEKLTWMNGEYIRRTEDYKLVDLLRPFLVEAGLVTQLFINSRWDYMVKFVGLLKDRCRLLSDFASQGIYFFTDEFDYEEKGVRKHFAAPEVLDRLRQWHNILEGIDPFNIEQLESSLRGLAEKLQIKPAMLIHPTRLAISGTTKGPSLFAMMELLSKEKCLARIKRAIGFVSVNNGN